MLLSPMRKQVANEIIRALMINQMMTKSYCQESMQHCCVFANNFDFSADIEIYENPIAQYLFALFWDQKRLKRS